MSFIITLIITGLILICAEIIIPGGILGGLGIIAFIAAVVLTWQEYGPMAGIWALIGTGVLSVLTIMVGLKILPKSKLGRGLFLSAKLDNPKKKTLANEDIIGKEGKTLTTLAPTGKIQIEEQSFEAFSKSGMLHANERVKVVAQDNFRLIIEKIPTEE